MTVRQLRCDVHGASRAGIHYLATPADPPSARVGRTSGLTLIELMVVLVIIGILGAIAVPAYQQYSVRARRTEAKTALLRLAANQERFYLQNNTYTDDLAALGFAAGVSDDGVYTLSVPQADTATYEAAAIPTPGAVRAESIWAATTCARDSPSMPRASGAPSPIRPARAGSGPGPGYPVIRAMTRSRNVAMPTTLRSLSTTRARDRPSDTRCRAA